MMVIDTPKLNNHKAYVAAAVSALVTLGAQQLGFDIAPDLVAESHAFFNELIASLGVGASSGLATWFTRAFPKNKDPKGDAA